MNGFQIGQLVVLNVHGNGKKEPGVASVNEFVVVVFDKVCVFLVPGRYQSMDLGFDAALFRFDRRRTRGRRRWWRDVPLGQSGFPLSILEQKESNHDGDYNRTHEIVSGVWKDGIVLLRSAWMIRGC